MPRPSKPSSQTIATDASRDVMHTFEANGYGFVPNAAEKDGHVSESGETTISAMDYAQGFGTGSGMCSCYRCLRKSAPSTTDYKEAVSDVAMCLGDFDASEDDDNDSSISQSPDQASQELAEALCQAAIEQADPVQLKELLKAVDDTQAAEICNTLAILAAQRGHAHIIPVLAEEGADFNRCDRYRGGPPLMHASNNGHANTVKALLEAGADVEGLDHVGQTALMVAVFSDRSQCAETLIKNGGANVHAEDNTGRTAMSHAAKYGSIDCLNLLGNVHADVFHKDNEGKTPLQIAEASSRSEAVMALKRAQGLQTMRIRCEKKKQKDATRRQEELTTEQLTEKQANADACAQALLADLAAEKEKESLTQKAKAKKAKAKGKAKASAIAAHANETLPANADVDVKDEAPSAGATQPPSDQEHQVNAQPNSESLSRNTAQPAAAPQVFPHKSSNGVSTLQSSPSDPRDPDDSPSAASDNMVASRSQSPVPNVSQPPITQPAQALRSPVPSSLASSPMQSPRPRSAASEADSMPDAPSVNVPSPPCSQSSHALSPSLPSRLPQSPANQQAFSQQLRSALSLAGSQSHPDSSLQKQATQKPPATPRGHKAEQPTGATSFPPSRPDSPIVPQHSAAVQSASPRRPSFASTSEPASVMMDMTNALPRGAPASPGPRSGIASPRQLEQGTHAHAASNLPPADRQAAAAAAVAAAAALTGPPKANAEAAQPASSQAPSHHSSEQSSRSASPFQRAAAALPPLAAVSPAGKSKGVSSSDSSRPVSADAPSPIRASQDEAAVPTSPPVTTPVRKPPGLPSPVPAAQDPGSADLESVISSDRWGDQISAKSETSSNPRSPKKGIKVPAVVAPAPPPPALASVSAAPSEIMSDVVSEGGSSFEEDKQSVTSSQLDQSAAAIAARLAKEREQQLKQEAKHLAGKERAAAKRRQEIAEQDRRQQEEHARRAQQKAAAAAEKAALNNPGLRPAAAGPFAAPPAGFREPYRGLKGVEEAAAKQAPKQYPAAGVKHVPAHPAPHQVRLPASDWSDNGSDYGSDYGEHELVPQGRGQGRGRGAALDRGARAATRGAGRGGRGAVPDLIGGHAGPGRGNQPKGTGADPLAFVPGYKPVDPPGPKRNPDPIGFGAARSSVVRLEAKLTEFSDQIFASREDSEQEFVHMHVLDELKKMVGHCKVQKIPPPVGAKEAISDLEKTVQARHQLERALIPPLDGALLEGAIYAGRSCKLLCKQIVHKAEAALREFNRNIQASQRPPPDPRKHAEPRAVRPPRADARGHPEAGRARPNPRGNPDPRGHPDPRGYAGPQGHPDYRGQPQLRGQPEARGQADPRGQRPDNRARADARPRAEAPQQRYVPQQPQPEQQRRHGLMEEPHNGRHMVPEYGEAPNKPPPRGHANPANPPRKGHGARNQAGPAPIAAAAAAHNQGHAVNNAPQPPASHAAAAKPAVAQESDDCVVCWAHVKNVVCVPCGHVAMCKSCSKAVVAQSGLCPVCRVGIREIIPFYKT